MGCASIRRAVVGLLLAASCGRLSFAADFDWEAVPLTSDWANASNWAGPLGQFPDDAGDTATVDGSNGTDPILNVDVTVGGLTITDGGDVFTGASSSGSLNNFELDVQGATVIDGAGSDLFVRESGTFIDFTTDTLTVSDLGRITLQGNSEIQINESGAIQNTGRIIGEGTVRLNSTTGNLINNGTISANTTGGTGTLIIDGSGSNTGLFDWDGTGSGTSDLNVFSGATLDIRLSQNSDVYQGFISVLQDGVFLNAFDWSTGGGSNVALVGLAGTATIGGTGSFTNGAGSTVNVSSGTGLIDTDFANSGDVTVANGATLDIGPGNTVTLAGGTISGAGTYLPRTTTVTGEVDITVDTFDFDRAPTTVEPGGVLDIDVQSYDTLLTEKYDSTLTVNSGRASIGVANNPFVMDGTLNLNNTDGTTAEVSGFGGIQIGDDVGSGGANINTGGTGLSRVTQTPITFNSDADVEVAAGTTLQLRSAVFNSVNGLNNAEFTGGGTLLMGSVQVNEETTIDMPGGSVSLDTVFLAVGAPDSSIDAPLTINTGTLEEYGLEIFLTFTDINIDTTVGGQLNVNLDAADSWVINEDGRINFDGDNSPDVALTGSELEMGGVMTVTGRNTTEASLTITGTVDIPNAGDELRLDGIPLAVISPHRIEGGTVSGDGELSAEFDVRLTGFGTIDADIDFDGPSQFFSAELLADDGTLNVNSEILEVGFLGTADSDGVLNLGQAFNTSVAVRMVLNGGSVTGAAITNDGEIRGHGTIASADLNNIGTISADGGLLILDTVLEADIDGENPNDGDGVLNAIDGSLRHVSGIGAGSFLVFDGQINVGVGESFEITGGGIQAQPGAVVNFTTGGTLFAPGFRQGGTLTTSGSEAVIASPVIDFGSFGNSLLAADLRLTGEAIVRVGASIADGGGDLIVDAPSTLQAEDGATIGADLLNEGTVSPGTLDVVDVGLLNLGGDFTQALTGQLEIDLSGTGAGFFDTLAVTDLASLDGTLDVSLLAGFDPVVGDSFEILTAGGGVAGTFDTLLFPALDPGEFMIISYGANSVTLSIVDQGFEADFDKDGDVDEDDLAEWEEGFGMPALATMSDGDADMDGDVDLADLMIWQQQFGSQVGGLVGVAVVPEPSAPLLLFLCGSQFILTVRHRCVGLSS